MPGEGVVAPICVKSVMFTPQNVVKQRRDRRGITIEEGTDFAAQSELQHEQIRRERQTAGEFRDSDAAFDQLARMACAICALSVATVCAACRAAPAEIASSTSRADCKKRFNTPLGAQTHGHGAAHSSHWGSRPAGATGAVPSSRQQRETAPAQRPAKFHAMRADLGGFFSRKTALRDSAGRRGIWKTHAHGTRRRFKNSSSCKILFSARAGVAPCNGFFGRVGSLGAISAKGNSRARPRRQNVPRCSRPMSVCARVNTTSMRIAGTLDQIEAKELAPVSGRAAGHRVFPASQSARNESQPPKKRHRPHAAASTWKDDSPGRRRESDDGGQETRGALFNASTEMRRGSSRMIWQEFPA